MKDWKDILWEKIKDEPYEELFKIKFCQLKIND